MKHYPLSLALLVCILLSSHPIHGAVKRAAKAEYEQCTQRVTALMQEKMEAMKIPGAILSLQVPGLCRVSQAFGVADLETGRKMQKTDHVRIGSITKTFVGTVVLQLFDEGKLKLDEPISQYLANVPNGENITIRQLLNMTSGLYDYGDDVKLNASLDKDPAKSWDAESLLAIAFGPEHKPYFEPGKGFHYSNTNTILLGQLIEKITGNRLEAELKSRIFNPLHMGNTLMPKRGSGDMPIPHAKGYRYGSNVDETREPCAIQPNERRDVTYANPDWAWSAGAVISTVDDLQIWAKVLAQGKLLSGAAQAARFGWVAMNSQPGVGLYGLGVANFRGWIGHNGGIPGYQSFMAYLPEREASLVILTNVNPNEQCKSVADELTKAILIEFFPELLPGMSR